MIGEKVPLTIVKVVAVQIVGLLLGTRCNLTQCFNLMERPCQTSIPSAPNTIA